MKGQPSQTAPIETKVVITGLSYNFRLRRTRQEIENDSQQHPSWTPGDRLLLEVLLDIRDLLETPAVNMIPSPFSFVPGPGSGDPPPPNLT